MSLTKISNNSLSGITTLPASIPTGALTLLSTQTASASASIEFTSGIDSTYDSYVFKFINVAISNNHAVIEFQGSIDGGSSYGVTTTSTNFLTLHNEADTETNLIYNSSQDLAQSTAFIDLTDQLSNDVDACLSGQLQIFNPSSNVFVKHWISTTTWSQSDPATRSMYCAGYFNDGANDINAIKFQVSAGTFDGIIKMYGVS